MIDTLFWYTGLVAWMLIAFGAIWTFVVEGMAGRRSPATSHDDNP
jgi:hypothetical protein